MPRRTSAQPFPTPHRRIGSLLITAGLAIGLGVVSLARGGDRSFAQPPAVVRPGAPALLVAGAGTDTRVRMRGVDFHAADGVVLHIHRLDGTMRGRDGVVNFDDPGSYVTTIVSAEVALRGSDLSTLMNRHVFAYPGAPLRKLHVEMRDGLVRQSGILRKGVDIPFTIEAEPSLMADGRIRLHPRRIRILGVNGAALMRALGLSLQKMVDLRKAVGVSVDHDDLLLDATAILPPPAIRGRLTRVRVVGDELVQTFGVAGDTAAPPALPDTATNYMLYRGGTLRFGKLYMVDAEMLVVDADPRDPFDFDNPRYLRQLVAGGSRTLPDLGLEVRMPDAHALRGPPP